MKFATQHRTLTIDRGGSKQTFAKHRDGATAWVTQVGKKGDHLIIGRKEFASVAQAGTWMNSTDLL